MAAHMNKIRFFRLLIVVCVVSAAAGVRAQAKSDADLLIQNALKPSPIEHNLRHLTDEIGGRVPGTPAMDRAVQWGVDAFKAAGGENVHTEPTPMTASWSEGNTQVNSVIPVRFHGRALPFTWSRRPRRLLRACPLLMSAMASRRTFKGP